MKNFKKGAAFGVAFAVAGLGLATPAFAADVQTPEQLVSTYEASRTQENFENAYNNIDPTSALFDKLVALAADNDKDEAAVDAYRAKPTQTNFEKAWDATKDNTVQRERLVKAAANVQKATDGLAETLKDDKQKVVDAPVLTPAQKSDAAKAVDAYRAKPTQTNFEKAWAATEDNEAQRNRLVEAAANIQKATDGLAKTLKDPARKESFKERLHRYQNDENVKNATEGLSEYLKDGSAKTDSKKETIPAMKLTPAKKADEAKKGNLAKTGVAVGALAGIAALSTLGGAATLRRRNH